MSPRKFLTSVLRGVGVLAAVLPVLVAGCGGDVDDRPASWSYIYPAIIEPSCATASCHSDFTRRAGVNFGYKDEAYYQLVQRHFVTPPTPPDPTCMTVPTDSELLYLLRAQGTERMPPDFALPEADIATIQCWIAAGAMPN
jgi:hypothetical protein